jgi:hypothetical protein
MRGSRRGRVDVCGSERTVGARVVDERLLRATLRRFYVQISVVRGDRRAMDVVEPLWSLNFSGRC